MTGHFPGDTPRQKMYDWSLYWGLKTKNDTITFLGVTQICMTGHFPGCLETKYIYMTGHFTVSKDKKCMTITFLGV